MVDIRRRNFTIPSRFRLGRIKKPHAERNRCHSSRWNIVVNRGWLSANSTFPSEEAHYCVCQLDYRPFDDVLCSTIIRRAIAAGCPGNREKGTLSFLNHVLYRYVCWVKQTFPFQNFVFRDLSNNF